MKKARFKQVAALPYRKHGTGVDVLLITSRETKRWVIPKGWPMDGKKDWEAAATEAFEEAGIEGTIGRKSIGTYHYVKRKLSGDLDCKVIVYPLEVKNELKIWPEKAERKRRWFSAEAAAAVVTDDGLDAIIIATLV